MIYNNQPKISAQPHPLLKFLIKWLISTVALLVVVHIFSGVSSENFLTTLIMALVLGFLNTFLKPILALLALPVMVLTLGLFMLVINATTFFLAAKLVHGFYVAGFGSALWAALLYSFITFLINILIQSQDEKNYYLQCKTVYKTRKLK
ncbi:MAG: hypothetical protein A2X78_03140 [Gammaproteobacteria bacterium GWE2_37_16]|nr:MAG: hypothetical protein A2X78_03140 [Gammaproteobacteria bacterium GWE2_37_16]